MFGPDLPAAFVDTTTDGWSEVTRRLAATKAFRDEEAPALFLRTMVSPEHKPEDLISATGTGLVRKLRVQRGETYNIKVTHYFPLQRTDYGATATCTAVLGDELQAKSILLGTIDTEERSFLAKFQVRRFVETTESHIAVTAQPPGGFAAVLASVLDFRLELGAPRSIIGWTVGLGFLYTAVVGTLTLFSLDAPSCAKGALTYAATGGRKRTQIVDR
jgi:hypothetical protein